MFGATLEGADELARTWQSVVAELRNGAATGVREGSRLGAQEARSRHPFRNRTGALERSIQHSVLGWSGDVFYADIRASENYASYVEDGTKAHVIEARAAKALRFVGGDGQLHFAKIVHHPGTPPLPFMGLAYIKAESVIIRELELSVVRAQEKLDR